MNRTVLFIVVLGYLLSPYVFTWLADPNGSWYRPFIVWGLAAIVLSFMSGRISRES